jgi:hypothetical protein
MTTTASTSPPVGRVRPRPESGPLARRVGHAVAIAVDVVLLLLVNRSPGWQAVPFLTPDTEQVLGLVNASLAAGVVVNLVLLVADPAWLRALGEVVTTAVGLAALVAVWQVWPLDLTVAWDLVARLAVGVGIMGSVIGIVAAVVRFVRELSAPR